VAKTMSGSNVPFGSSSARNRLRAECEERGVAYPLAFDKHSGTIILCEQCPCLVTNERYLEARAAVIRLQKASEAAPPGVYLVWWNESGLGCRRIGSIQ
jgi:hypothetical protein